MITYNTKNRTLYFDDGAEIRLSKNEDKLLKCLTTDRVTRYEEIIKYLDISETAFRGLKTRFIEKVEYFLHIRKVRNVGLMLEDEINFE